MHLIKIKKDGQHLPHSLPPGALLGSSSSEYNDAYAGIAPGRGSNLTTSTSELKARTPIGSEKRKKFKASILSSNGTKKSPSK